MKPPATLEEVMRDSHSRLLAYLVTRSGNFATAEDALGDALLEAVKKWPEEGLPENPCAWLLTVAKRRLIDQLRHEIVHQREEENLRYLFEEAQQLFTENADFPDERLKLLFACTHPAIDISARTPLMLQTVLGIEASRIAKAFITSPEAMSQRLVRAKTKIRDAGIPFRVPEAEEWKERFPPVLDAIYAAYTAGWERTEFLEGEEPLLGLDAISLGRLLVRLLPHEPEVRGLLSLMLHIEARKPARFTQGGTFVSLLDQDPGDWTSSLIDEAEFHLKKASVHQELGRYQLEAAIQSVHSSRRFSLPIQWTAIIGFYDLLLTISDSIGAAIGRASALAHDNQSSRALEALNSLDSNRVQNHQPYWVTRGHILQCCGFPSEAIGAWRQAIGLTRHESIRRHLYARIENTK